MIAVMAAYGKLYDYLMSPDAHDAFVEARRHAQTKFEAPSAEATWAFNQRERPYSKDLSVFDTDIDYLQDMFVRLGMQKRRRSIASVASMSAAHAAARLIG